LEFRTTSSAFP